VLKHKKVIALVLAAATVVTLYLTGAFPDLPDVKKLIAGIAAGLGQWTYALVGTMAFLETGAFVGLLAPGETVVIVGGVIAGQGEISLVPLIGLVWACSVLGDTTSFFIGRRLGRDFMLRHGPKIRIDEKRLEQVESYFERHGGKTILVGRFIGLVRAMSPFVAGSSGLPYSRFIPFSVIGCALWSTLFCVLGYVFYRSFDQVTAIAGKATLAFAITVAVIAGMVYVYRKLRGQGGRRALARWIERQERRPALRPLFSVVQTIWRRVTPGALGLELITLLAVSGVGFYVFALYAVILADHPATTTPADLELLDLADDLRSGEVGLDIARLITSLGSFATVAALVLGVGLVLLVRRHVTEAVALVAGSLLVYLAVRLAKEGIARPRPVGPLESAEGLSYPSGHAAYSTIWVGVALAVAGAVPGFARRAALITAAFVIAVAAGLSRIYLRVHYWSDVAGGWGLGAGILGAAAAIALTVSHIRQNEGSASSERTSWTSLPPS
jgi:undecaprenyl-diphosphatase